MDYSDRYRGEAAAREAKRKESEERLAAERESARVREAEAEIKRAEFEDSAHGAVERFLREMREAGNPGLVRVEPKLPKGGRRRWGLYDGEVEGMLTYIRRRSREFDAYNSSHTVIGWMHDRSLVLSIEGEWTRISNPGSYGIDGWIEGKDREYHVYTPALEHLTTTPFNSIDDLEECLYAMYRDALDSR
ncbi:MAG: hypothetical protein IPJ61_04860 [Tessaracoccus sp.]|uniref:hypothetical protein n=1 Tax=Tessaracoccus sp. TaxID=1971211 RepID=UPI001EBA2FC3|nr:hypothetical protein [Tessaracoccus sp.]MBK7820407.1 hypothetical protein [Tessaracoccus sp.]